MRSVAGLIVGSVVLLAIVYLTWLHMHQASDSAELQAGPILEQARQTGKTSAEQQDANRSVAFGVPLATYVSKQGRVPVEKLRTASNKSIASDHVGGSVAGTSLEVLHEKFRVLVIVDQPFDVPAHAATPQLIGTFRSFMEAGGKPASETNSDVEFRLLSDDEFSNFLDGKPSEALFSAAATHNAEVNASLPPTLNKPTTYHLVFLNDSRKRKVVQADFRLDF